MGLGNHPYGKGWEISSISHFDDVVVLYNQCYTTSGYDPCKRFHIINPVKGERVKKKEIISIITETGTEGEVLSTALFAAPIEIRQKLADEYKISFNIKEYSARAKYN